MCGIAGIIHPQSGIPRNFSQTVLSALKHRGPDSQGVFVAPSGKICFAHTRLSIQDLSGLGNQPMTTTDGRYTIIFNGEIYNFKKLRKELEATGETFISYSDTEVILKLYKAKNEKCLFELEGMFAFAIWDEVEQTCFLARDPYGIKPLYYYDGGEQFAFASECRALVKSLNFNPTWNGKSLQAFLMRGSIPEPQTTFEEIKQLPAGHYAFWRENSFENPIAYFRLETPKKFAVSHYKDAVALTRRALLESLRKHFVSDVNVGVFLSGGLDSTALVALSREMRLDLSTYTIGFEGHVDETKIAHKTAQHFKTNHHEIRLSARQASGLLATYLEVTDLPTIDGFNVFAVSQLAHAKSEKVILSGVGGDELFGGYPSFVAVPKLYKQSQSSFGRILLNLTASSMANFKPQWRRFKNIFQPNTTLHDIYFAYRGIFPKEDARFILETLKINMAEDEVLLPEAYLDWNLTDQVAFLERSYYLRNQLLRDADTFSMCYGLELRTPFVDAKLFETLAVIPPHWRLNRKRLLKDAVREIPQWVLNQPKRGFLLPFESWNILDKFFKKPKLKALAAKYSSWYQKLALLQLDKILSEQA